MFKSIECWVCGNDMRCNDRACDGRWDMLEAMARLHLIREIDSIKVKGLFKRKATMRAREEAWKKYNFKSIK